MSSDDELLSMVHSWDIVGMNLILGVTFSEPYEQKNKRSENEILTLMQNILTYCKSYRTVIKNNILKCIAPYGCEMTIVLSTCPSSYVLELNPNGVLFSDGPINMQQGTF